MTEKVVCWRCEVCRETYPTLEQAERCEAFCRQPQKWLTIDYQEGGQNETE